MPDDGSRRLGETANGRTGEVRIRAAGATSLRRFLRPGERIGLMAVAPPLPFAQSPPPRALLSLKPLGNSAFFLVLHPKPLQRKTLCDALTCVAPLLLPGRPVC